MNNPRGTLSFSLCGVPVQIQPLFWLIAALFSPFFSGSGSFDDSRVMLIGLAAWIAAWLLSFLIHEMGHALVVRNCFGAKPRIVLYGFGGVTLYQPYYTRSPGRSGNRLISFAGPGAEIASALILAGFLGLCGVPLSFGIDQFGPLKIPSITANIIEFWKPATEAAMLSSLAVMVFVNSFVWMGLFWGILNLLPIYPLDGGHIAREICQQVNPRSGLRVSLMISLVFAAVLIGYSVAERNFFIAIFFGLFANMNWTELKRCS